VKRIAAAFSFCALASCGRYSDFRLPTPNGSAREIRFEWEVDKDPVLRRGTGWDSVDVLNPSVTHNGGTYINLYSGFDGKTWRTGAASSSDGKTWTRGTLLFYPSLPWEGTYIAANGSLLSDRERLCIGTKQARRSQDRTCRGIRLRFAQ